MMSEYWSNKFSEKTKEQLEEIIDNASNYQPEAVEAARQLLDQHRTEPKPIDKPVEDAVVTADIRFEESLPIVSRTYRFAHNIIDSVIITFVASAWSVFMPLTNTITTYSFGSIALTINSLNGYVVMFLYFFVLEAVWQRTAGKLLTKTIVVDEDGNKLSIGKTFLRTLCRLIPFEAFSCLVSPSLGWHDRFSKSFGIYEAELSTFKTKMLEQHDVTEHLITQD
jgi:uncharacterized RDD family membrane protein YckC